MSNGHRSSWMRIIIFEKYESPRPLTVRIWSACIVRSLCFWNVNKSSNRRRRKMICQTITCQWFREIRIIVGLTARGATKDNGKYVFGVLRIFETDVELFGNSDQLIKCSNVIGFNHPELLHRQAQTFILISNYWAIKVEIVTLSI